MDALTKQKDKFERNNCYRNQPPSPSFVPVFNIKMTFGFPYIAYYLLSKIGLTLYLKF